MSYPVQFLVVVGVAMFAALKIVLQGFVSRGHIRTLQDSLWFNVLLFGTIALMFALLFPMGEVDGTILAYGLLLGISNVISQACYAFAFNAGPVSLTVLIASFNVFISALFSAVAFGESIYLPQLGGLVFLALSMLLNRSKSPDEKKANRKWLILTLVVMVSFGFGNTAQKLFWITESSKLPNSSTTLMIVMYTSACLAALAAYLTVGHTGKKEKSALRFRKPVVLYALAVGATLTIYQKLNMYGLEHIDGSFFFPTAIGTQTMLVTLAGVVLFHDKLSRNQKLSIVCGIICLALMNLRIGPSFTL